MFQCADRVIVPLALIFPATSSLLPAAGGGADANMPPGRHDSGASDVILAIAIRNQVWKMLGSRPPRRQRTRSRVAHPMCNRVVVPMPILPASINAHSSVVVVVVLAGSAKC